MSTEPRPPLLSLLNHQCLPQPVHLLSLLVTSTELPLLPSSPELPPPRSSLSQSLKLHHPPRLQPSLLRMTMVLLLDLSSTPAPLLLPLSQLLIATEHPHLQS